MTEVSRISTKPTFVFVVFVEGCRLVKDYRPLLLQTLDVRLPGLKLFRLRLNRHLPEADSLDAHEHRFSQTLCYLSGRGRFLAGTESHEVHPGALALVPPGQRHGFREVGGRRPLALALDFEMAGLAKNRLRVCQLNESEAARIRHHLSAISRIKDPSSEDSRLLAASAALAILDIQLRAIGVFPGRSAMVPSYIKKIQRLLSEAGSASISELAAETGYQPDYLNRRHKQTTGLTLRQQRNAIRLEKAKRLLALEMPISEVAMSAGFEDPNYFTRWFKRQTGLTPGRYRGSSSVRQARQ
jgi:AraC-like DNA-binding protein/mannose-6-phosphate isomerase-like protein (cupin superfamily)